MPCGAPSSSATWGRRRARMPPWTLGCRVLTRPSSISGKPVYFRPRRPPAPPIPRSARGAAGGQDLDAERGEAARELHHAGLVVHADAGRRMRSRGLLGVAWIRARRPGWTSTWPSPPGGRPRGRASALDGHGRARGSCPVSSGSTGTAACSTMGPVVDTVVDHARCSRTRTRARRPRAGPYTPGEGRQEGGGRWRTRPWEVRHEGLAYELQVAGEARPARRTAPVSAASTRSRAPRVEGWSLRLEQTAWIPASSRGAGRPARPARHEHDHRAGMRRDAAASARARRLARARDEHVRTRNGSGIDRTPRLARPRSRRRVYPRARTRRARAARDLRRPRRRSRFLG